MQPEKGPGTVSERVCNPWKYTNQEPGYLRLYRQGRLNDRVRWFSNQLHSCTLCPRRCRVDRAGGQQGFCKTGATATIAAVNVHPWEEPPVSGSRGSGTIFFTGCTLRCAFCQNFPISHLGIGREMSDQCLAAEMLRLERNGAHNINLVTATHQLPAFLNALVIAVEHGFHLPIVYNTSGYERVETLKRLEGIIDIYLPDIKYGSNESSRFCSGVSDYVEHNRKALKEMWRQVGPLRVDPDGIASRGMLVRHLVLPEDLAGTRDCLQFLKEDLGPDVWVSLMHQYFPAHRAWHKPPLDRKVTLGEYQRALEMLWELDLNEGFVQDRGECSCH